MKKAPDFESLTPDLIINSVEKATGQKMTGFTSPLPSYINRVYELQAMDGTRLVAKFYRPGRWTEGALADEHDFVLDCASDEIPVIAPLILENGQTVGCADGILFAVYPKRFGREFEINDDEDWRRLGRVIGRIHNAGAGKDAAERLKLHPEVSLSQDIAHLLDHGHVTDNYIQSFGDVTTQILDSCKGIFDDAENIRIHGDSHQKNILFRPEEGIMVIDFDDMMTGPPVQDLWLFLPDHANNSRAEINLLLQGYEQFREFDDSAIKLIEPLRAMRIIYFLAWCSKQKNDLKFITNFPDWGTDAFWKREITDLYRQLDAIKSHLNVSSMYNFNSI